MAKELKTRIALKYDSYTAWTTAPGKDVVLLRGELGICSIDAADQKSQVVPTVLFKVGDGEKTFEQLPWASAKAADVYNWAKAADVKLEGKVLKFVDAENNVLKSVTFDYATPADVNTVAQNLAKLDERVVDVEEAITAINDETNGILATAKGYTDSLVGTAPEGAEDIWTTIQSIQEAAYDDTAVRELIGKNATDIATNASNIGKNTTAIETEASNRATAITEVTSAYEAADAAIYTKIGTFTGTVKEAVDAAQNTANDAQTRVGTVENRLDGENGIDAKIAKNAADIAGVSGNLTSEVERLEGAISTAETNFGTKIGAIEKDTVAESITAAKDAAVTAAQGLVNTLAETVGDNTTAIGENASAIATEVEAREDLADTVSKMDTAYKAADALINEKFGAEYSKDATVASAIADAKKAGTDAAAAVKTLEEGAVATNARNISTNASDIATLRGDLTTEATTRDNADKALSARLEEVEAFFKTADGETLDTALDTLVEIQDYLNGEGEATGGLLSRVAANEQDISTINTRLSAEGNIGKAIADNTQAIAKEVTDRETAVSGEATARANADAAIEAKIGGSFTSENTVAKAITAAESSAKSHAETKVADLANGTVKINTENIGKNAQAIAGVDGRVTALETLTGTDGTIQTAIKAAKDQADKGVADAKAADDKAVAAQNAADAAQGDATKALADAATADGKAVKVASDLAAEVSDRAAADTQIRTDFAAADKAISDKIGTVAADTTVVDMIAAAEAAAKSHAETKVTDLANGTVKTNTDNIAKNAQAISKEAEDRAAAVKAEKEAREAADALINEKFGAEYSKDATVASAIATAESNAKTHAETKVNDLANGTVKTNTENIGKNAQAIGAIEGNYARIGSDNKLYAGKDGADMIIFDCGSATELV